MTGSFHISLFTGTLHVDKIRVRFKIASITHALPIPDYRKTDFTPKRVVVSRLHDTVARFRTRVKFAPRYKNRGELTPGLLAPTWHFVMTSSKRKVAPVSCKHPLNVKYELCFLKRKAKPFKKKNKIVTNRHFSIKRNFQLDRSVPFTFPPQF